MSSSLAPSIIVGRPVPLERLLQNCAVRERAGYGDKWVSVRGDVDQLMHTYALEIDQTTLDNAVDALTDGVCGVLRVRKSITSLCYDDEWIVTCAVPSQQLQCEHDLDTAVAILCKCIYSAQHAAVFARFIATLDAPHSTAAHHDLKPQLLARSIGKS